MNALSKWDEHVFEGKYLEILEKSDVLLEWIDERIYPKNNPYRPLSTAMAGASDNRINLTTALLLAIGTRLRGTNCFVVAQDQKVKASQGHAFSDVSVYCGEREKDKRGDLINPVVSIEILSSGTQGYHKGTKFEKLRVLSTLHDYPLVSQDRVLVEYRHRRDETHWEMIFYNRLDDAIDLTSIGITRPLAEIYERLSFD